MLVLRFFHTQFRAPRTLRVDITHGTRRGMVSAWIGVLNPGVAGNLSKTIMKVSWEITV